MFNKSRTYKHNDPLYRIKQGKVFNNNNKEAFANHYDERSKQDELAAQNESGLSDQEMSIIMAATAPVTGWLSDGLNDLGIPASGDQVAMVATAGVQAASGNYAAAAATVGIMAYQIWEENQDTNDDYEKRFFSGLSRDAPKVLEILQGKNMNSADIQHQIKNLEGPGWLGDSNNKWVQNRRTGIQKCIDSMKKILKLQGYVDTAADEVLDSINSDEGGSIGRISLYKKYKNYDSTTYTDGQLDNLVANRWKKFNNARDEERVKLCLRTMADIDIIKERGGSPQWAITKDLIRISNYDQAKYESEKNRYSTIADGKYTGTNEKYKTESYKKYAVLMFHMMARFKSYMKGGARAIDPTVAAANLTNVDDDDLNLKMKDNTNDLSLGGGGNWVTTAIIIAIGAWMLFGGGFAQIQKQIAK